MNKHERLNKTMCLFYSIQFLSELLLSLVGIQVLVGIKRQRAL